jgi:hypothetical protein
MSFYNNGKIIIVDREKYSTYLESKEDHIDRGNFISSQLDINPKNYQEIVKYSHIYINVVKHKTKYNKKITKKLQQYMDNITTFD